MDKPRTQTEILQDITRARQRYEARVERGDIDAARQARASLSDMLEELGTVNQDLELTLRREMKFPESRPPI